MLLSVMATAGVPTLVTKWLCISPEILEEGVGSKQPGDRRFGMDRMA